MSQIIVLGGHGKVAMIAHRLLTEAGHNVTAVIRNADQAPEIRETGAEPLVLDLEHATTEQLADAIAGHDAVVWSAGAAGSSKAATWAIDRDAAIRSMDAAESAGVTRYVMVSFQGASLDHGLPESDDFYAYAQAKAEADEHLRRSGLDWTILGPGYLTLDEPTGTVGVFEIPPLAESMGGEPPIADRQVSRADVAAMVAGALEEPASIGRQIEFGRGLTPIREALRG